MVYWQNEHYHSALTWGEVTVPESGFAAVAINSGVKFLAEPNAKPPYRVHFINLDTNKEYIWTRAAKYEPIPLPPGRYRLDWHENEHRTKRMTLAEEFKLDPGVLLEIQM